MWSIRSRDVLDYYHGHVAEALRSSKALNCSCP
jgi:hypothetical protein